MKIEKKVLASLNKCYAIAKLSYQGKEHILVAAEKDDPCYLFDLDGKLEDKIWDAPGGVMSMCYIPGTDGQFLSTCRFYSPDESTEASIVLVTPRGKGDWVRRKLVDLPHVHRFDILERGGVRYLIACTVKSGQDKPEGDWSYPGKVYAAVLPEDLSPYDAEHQLPLTVLKDGMHRNHGYYRVEEDGVPTSVIACDEGVFRFTPPAAPGGEWEIEPLLDAPVSDAVLVDLDGDGEKELCTLAPFHGERISVYKKQDGAFQKVYDFPEDTPFTHAIFGGELCGVPSFVTGHRAGKRNLLCVRYDKAAGAYGYTLIDEGRGPANVLHYVHAGKDVIIAANRETDEVAMYTVSE